MLDSVDDSEESEAADMGRLGKRFSSDLLSFVDVDNPEPAAFVEIAIALIAMCDVEVLVLDVAISWFNVKCETAEISNASI